MGPRHKVFNPKRKIAPRASFPEEQRSTLAKQVKYGGNPEHKKYPNDYGLVPPTDPRPGKTLCDAGGSFPKAVAEKLIQSGLERGLVSEQQRGGWPQNIWAVADDGEMFEAQLENQVSGTYHGYPMAQEDDFRQVVKTEWERRSPHADH